MEYVELVRDFGVAIGVLLWFMFRMEKRLDRYDRTINDLIKTINDADK